MDAILFHKVLFVVDAPGPVKSILQVALCDLVVGGGGWRFHLPGVTPTTIYLNRWMEGAVNLMPELYLLGSKERMAPADESWENS